MDQPITERTHPHRSKKDYIRPELIIYGEVKKLVQAGSKGMPEFNSCSRNKRAGV